MLYGLPMIPVKGKRPIAPRWDTAEPLVGPLPAGADGVAVRLGWHNGRFLWAVDEDDGAGTFAHRDAIARWRTPRGGIITLCSSEIYIGPSRDGALSVKSRGTIVVAPPSPGYTLIEDRARVVPVGRYDRDVALEGGWVTSDFRTFRQGDRVIERADGWTFEIRGSLKYEPADVPETCPDAVEFLLDGGIFGKPPNDPVDFVAHLNERGITVPSGLVIGRARQAVQAKDACTICNGRGAVNLPSPRPPQTDDRAARVAKAAIEAVAESVLDELGDERWAAERIAVMMQYMYRNVYAFELPSPKVRI